MKKYLPYVLYFILAALVMRPFFGGGFLFLLDMVWAPNIQLSDHLLHGIPAAFPFILIFKTLSFVISTAAIQKILLLTIFVASGSTMYYLARKYMRAELAWTAGLFFMLNPYVYERFLAGQWLVWAGYAYFPLIVALFLVFLEKPDNKNFYKFSLLLALYPIISPHWAYMASIFLAFTGLVHLWREKAWLILASKIFWRRVGFIALLFLLVNSFWLFSFFGENSVLPKITLNDFAAFKTLGDSQFGAYYNVLSLYGFWSTANFLPKDLFSSWWVLTIFSLGLSVLGAWKLVKEKKLIGLVLAMVFLPIIVVAVGYGSVFSRLIVNALYNILPGFKGLRETEKLVGILAFSYALLIPFGTKYFFEICGLEFKKRFFSAASLLSLSVVAILVFLSTFGIFNSFNQQLKTYNYPAGWDVVEEKLATDPNTKTMLFLPWHGYSRLDFAGYEKVGNPARQFFSVPVVAGRTMENAYLLENDQGEWDIYVAALLDGSQNLDDNINFLKERGISHIVLAKIHDFEKYDFLNKSEMLAKEYEDQDIILYRVK